MLPSLEFREMNKNKIICKQPPTDSTVELSIAADTAIIKSLTALLMPFKHHNNTSQYVSKENTSYLKGLSPTALS